VASLTSLIRGAGRASAPERGLRAIAALREELEALERHHVARAVADGWSWSQVALALGVTKQAAHKKHAKAVRAQATAAEVDAVPSNDRVVVTGAAREAVRLARREAQAVGAATVGTEHLLVGVLLAVGPDEARILEGCGVDAEAARACLQPTLAEEDRAIAVTSADTADAAAATGVSPLARACLEQSLRESIRRQDRELDVKHLLLAILSRPDGGAARTLECLGTSAETIRRLLEARASL
jgi:hypothetical protein